MSHFFDKVLDLKFKKRLADYRWATISAKYLYSLRRPQPQNYTLDLGYSLMINNKYFQSKYLESSSKQ